MSDLNSARLELSLPGNISFLETAISYIVNCAKVFGLSKKELSQIQLAAEEALINIINNSLNNDPNEIYTIICRWLPTRMEVVIRDKGMPFSPAEIPDYNPEALADLDNMEGLSMYLLKHSVDEVHFRNRGRDGKETVLVKNIEAQRIDNIIREEVATEETKRNIEDNRRTASIPEWHLRSFRPGDALEISRCAFQAYGYSYETYIYYPERITEMNQQGELKSVVAVDQNENLLAHIALKFYHPNDPIAEMGVAFVKPAGRRLNIFSKLCLDAYNKAQKQGLQGLYGRAVTSHPLSQKKLIDDNFINCGVLLGLFPADVDFKELTGKVVQKESALLMFLPLKSPIKTIYPPKKHAEIVDEIFANGSIKVITGDSSKVKSDNNTAATDTQDKLKLSHSRMEVFNTADIICYSSDLKIVDDVLSAKKSLCLERTDVLYLFLDLENPGCPKLAQACEELGFFFSGVLPYGLHGRHALILQYLNNLAIDYDKIKLHAPFAQKLLLYIKNCEQC